MKALFNSPPHVRGGGVSFSDALTSVFSSASSALRLDVAKVLAPTGFFFRATGASSYCDLIESWNKGN